MTSGEGEPTAPRKRTAGEWVLRLAALFIGLVVSQLGVTLFILPALGSDPFTILVQGWSVQLGVSVGTSQMIIQAALTLTFLLTTRGYILPGTVLCFCASGPLIDLYFHLLRDHVTPALPLALRLGVVLLGVVITALGLAILVKSNAGLAANDLIAIVTADKYPRIPFRWARVGSDFLYASLGFCLGGVLGMSSVMAVLLVGPTAQLFVPVAQRVVDRVVGLNGKVAYGGLNKPT